jgi:serine/threonine protein kinase
MTLGSHNPWSIQDNVLVDAEGIIPKTCDFGSSNINCQCYTGPREQEGTIPWGSPELWLEESPRTPEADIWAFGCIALEVSYKSLSYCIHFITEPVSDPDEGIFMGSKGQH